MSDMIDRLRTISAGAGRDIAADLATPSTITALEGRVRSGVRRRRIRLGAIGASVAAALGVAVIAAPTLLSALPKDPEQVQPGIVRAVGPITTYEDDSVSVVLSSGELVRLPAYEGDLAFQYLSMAERCAVESPAELPSGSWVSTDPGVNRIVRQVTLWETKPDGTQSPILAGAALGQSSKSTKPNPFVTVQVDPAVAPFIAIKVTTWDFQVTSSDQGDPSYYTVYAQSVLEGEPEPQYSGSADLGTRVGTLTTRNLAMGEWSTCYKPEDLKDPHFWSGTVAGYVVVDVFLVDRKGGSYPLGTSVFWFTTEVSA